MTGEPVSAFYSGSPATGTITSAFNVMTYGTVVKDSPGSSYSAGTWTCPISGTYSIAAAIDVSGTYAAANRTMIEIWVNGAAVARGSTFAGSSSTGNLLVPASIHSYPILAGQTVQIKAFSEATSPVLTSTVQNNFFSIVRTGNY